MQNADLPTLLKTRQFLSQVSGGQKLASGASDQSIGQQKRIATQLLGAIDNDLDASADKLGGDVGAALKTANANYAQKSQQIEGIKRELSMPGLEPILQRAEIMPNTGAAARGRFPVGRQARQQSVVVRGRHSAE